MKTNHIKRLATLVVLFAFVVAVSSCSRKMGCPTNLSFSVDNISLSQDIDDSLE